MNATEQPTVLMITVKGGEFEPQEVRLNDAVIGWRASTGASHSDVCREVTRALATLLCERLDYSPTNPYEDDYL